MIHLKHITKQYGDKVILQNVSLSLPETGVLCLMGPSGCGKTTLLRILLGLDSASGEILGLSSGSAAVLFQEDRLLPWFTVCENLTRVTNCSFATAQQLLEAVGLTAETNHYPAHLSGGMQRRVALARALAYPSQLLVLDEPFQGMDAALRQQLYPFIHTAAQTKPVLLVTHDHTDAEALADQILICTGPPLQFMKD